MTATAKTQVLRPGAEWDAWVQRSAHDFYHRSGYHAFAESMGEGKAQLLIHGTPECFVAWPQLLRTIENGMTDAGSVYGYTGPIGPGLLNPDFLQVAWSAFQKVWAKQKQVTLFTRMHPLLDNASPCAGLTTEISPSGGSLLTTGRSVSIDATLDTDTRRALYPQPLRQDVKRAEREGVKVILDRNWDYFDDFVRLYIETMQRSGASQAYHFSRDYFDRLRFALADVGHLAVAVKDSHAIGALLFTVCGEHAAAHLTGTDAAFNRYSPLKLLLDRGTELVASLGGTRLHLGAGRGGFEDSLFDFKSRFSKTRHDFTLGRWILDRNAYEVLVRKNGAEPDEFFFPAYRLTAPEVRAAE